MIKRNLVKLLLASAVILLPMAVGMVLWYELPASMAIHWGVSGDADGFSGKGFAVFGLPLILLALFWLAVVVTLKDPRNKDQNAKAIGMVLWIVPLLSLVVNGLLYATALGYHANMMAFMCLMLGFIFMLFGNYMPKCKQNTTIGIKIRPTLESEDNWNATHRVAGKVWFVGGFVVMLCAFLPDAMIAILFVLLAALVTIPIVYSYWFRRKQQMNGGADIKPMEKTKFDKVMIAVASVIVPLILIGAVILMFTGNVRVTCDDTALTVSATYGDDITVSYADIDSVEYREDFDAGVRVSGFGSARLLLGTFENEEFGPYTLYAYNPCEAAVVLHDGEHVLVLSGKDAAETMKLYETIKEYCM